MDGADFTPPAAAATTTMLHQTGGGDSTTSSRPTLGFPLGTALLLIVIFCISGIFSCCYHWEKLRSLRRRGPHSASRHDLRIPPDTKIPSKLENLKQGKDQSLPVIMPGDRIPKFMALPCPCQQPISAKITVEVVLASSTPTNPTPTTLTTS